MSVLELRNNNWTLCVGFLCAILLMGTTDE